MRWCIVSEINSAACPPRPPVSAMPIGVWRLEAGAGPLSPSACGLSEQTERFPRDQPHDAIDPQHVHLAGVDAAAVGIKHGAVQRSFHLGDEVRPGLRQGGHQPLQAQPAHPGVVGVGDDHAAIGARHGIGRIGQVGLNPGQAIAVESGAARAGDGLDDAAGAHLADAVMVGIGDDTRRHPPARRRPGGRSAWPQSPGRHRPAHRPGCRRRPRCG